MDVESLAKELILKNMTPEQQMAVLDSVRQSVVEAKEVQKRKIGENVDLVVQALKKIESDIRDRFDSVGNAIEKRVASIKDGRDGINGKDGRDGKDGKSGKDGAVGPAGRDGLPGRDGVDGANGVSVSSARVDFDGSLIISLDNGREINVGEVVAPDLAERIKVITNGGGTSQYVLDTLASLQSQISAITGGLTYKGTWNASTNTPTLTSSVGTTNWYYVVSVSGSTNLNGITDWVVGDWAIYNGTAWQKIDQTNLVTSVNGQTGAVSLTYTDVNAIGSVTSVDGSVTVSTASGVADLSVAVAASTTNVIVQIRNTTGSTLTKGTAVYISGATGQTPTVSKALATSDATSAQTLGLISADLANNTNGYVTVIGLITNIDTSAYTDGAQLYLSGTTAGTLTATKTYAPTHLVYVAVVEHAHPTQGKLFVKVQNGYELDEIHNVSAQSPSNGQTIIYNETTSLWEKATLTGTASQVTVTNGAGSITLSLPSTINVNTSGNAANVTGTVAVANGGTGATTAPTARTNLGATTVGSNLFTLTNPSAITFPRLNADNSVSALDASTFRTAIGAGTSSTTGTVTSVGGTGTVNGLTLTGTVTSSGNLTLGGTLDLSSPPAIGGTTPSTGAFTTLKVGSSSILGNANADVTLGLAVRNSGASMGYLQTYNGNASTDLKTWRFGGNSSGNLIFETVNDAYSAATNRMTLDGSGNLTATSFNTTNFTIVQSGTKLLFKYGATTIASMDSTGIITSATNIVANGTP